MRSLSYRRFTVHATPRPLPSASAAPTSFLNLTTRHALVAVNPTATTTTSSTTSRLFFLFFLDSPSPWRPFEPPVQACPPHCPYPPNGSTCTAASLPKTSHPSNHGCQFVLDFERDMAYAYTTGWRMCNISASCVEPWVAFKSVEGALISSAVKTLLSK